MREHAVGSAANPRREAGESLRQSSLIGRPYALEPDPYNQACSVVLPYMSHFHRQRNGHIVGQPQPAIDRLPPPFQADFARYDEPGTSARQVRHLDNLSPLRAAKLK